MSRLLSCRLLLAFAVSGCVSTATYAQEDKELTPSQRLEQAWELSENRQTAKAVELADKVIEANPDNARAYYQRGRDHLRLGNFKESVADFDKFIELQPASAKRLWERGIALYYAGEFEEGAKQFAAYQTYQDNDVENAVWCYICQAKQKSPDFARENLMKTREDRRVPMAEVFQMFAGDLEPEKVIAAAESRTKEGEGRRYAVFYAHLYVGLYHEAQGNEDLAKKHITAAADTADIDHYMWDVAKVHKDLLNKQ